VSGVVGGVVVDVDVVVVVVEPVEGAVVGRLDCPRMPRRSG
jgi:hypothetical protein